MNQKTYTVRLNEREKQVVVNSLVRTIAEHKEFIRQEKRFSKTSEAIEVAEENIAFLKKIADRFVIFAEEEQEGR